MNNTDEKQTQDTASNFKNRRVFTTKKDYWGMPGDLFIAGVALCLGLSVSVAWWSGPLIGLAYFPTIYSIHKDDPCAAKAWLRGLKRKHNYWVAGKIEPLSVTFLPSRGGQHLSQSKEKVKNEIDCFN